MHALVDLLACAAGIDPHCDHDIQDTYQLLLSIMRDALTLTATYDVPPGASNQGATEQRVQITVLNRSPSMSAS